jgi:CBS domain-containing protein
MMLKDYMQATVNGVPVGMSAADALRFLKDRHFGGAPVVDADGHVVGMISLWDLIDASGTVGDEMTPHVIALDASATVFQAAKLMLADNIHRVVVLEQGRLVGMVTTFDLVRALASLEPTT